MMQTGIRIDFPIVTNVTWDSALEKLLFESGLSGNATSNDVVNITAGLKWKYGGSSSMQLNVRTGAVEVICSGTVISFRRWTGSGYGSTSQMSDPDSPFLIELRRITTRTWECYAVKAGVLTLIAQKTGDRDSFDQYEFLKTLTGQTGQPVENIRLIK